jgi:hypothetical protein
MRKPSPGLGEKRAYFAGGVSLEQPICLLVAVYSTNRVNHFRREPRGSLRIRKKPSIETGLTAPMQTWN